VQRLGTRQPDKSWENRGGVAAELGSEVQRLFMKQPDEGWVLETKDRCGAELRSAAAVHVATLGRLGVLEKKNRCGAWLGSAADVHEAT
jgi:hypothetical protein